VHPSELERLRGDSAPTTHLARYERASRAPKRAKVREVLDVDCPDCWASAGDPCVKVES
jgi:hypothetical protein